MKKIIIFAFLLFVIKATDCFAQNEKFKALFMYNFTKYIEWPDASKQGDFIIGVLGNSTIVEELEIIAAKKLAGTQKIVVKKFAAPEEISACHILYIPPNKCDKFGASCSKLGGTKTLIISDGVGLIEKGAGINYVTLDGKQSFEISQKNIEAKGLKVNTQLLSLGIVK